MAMTLQELCHSIRKTPRALRTDSRKVEAGDIFVALPPAARVGADVADQRADHIQDALRRGAGIVVADPAFAPLLASAAEDGSRNCGFLPVSDTRAALGRLAAANFGTEHLPFPVIGVTGTNGKTTCAYLLEHAWKSRGARVGVLGTVSYRWPGHEEAAPLTTPGCLEIHECLAAMRRAGVDAAIMEVSSHALDQNRIAGVEFAGAVFTNLTQDHLDYHDGMEDYFSAKKKLFTSVPRADKVMAVNADDPYGRRLLAEIPRAVPFGSAGNADGGLCCEVLSDTPAGMELRLSWQGTSWQLNSPLVGKHNASNLSAVIALCLQMGFTPSDFSCFHDFFGVSGRLERIPVPETGRGAGVGIFVDYAHTPDALTRAQEALRDAGFSRIITVFGCGGDRDRTKRPLMGKSVASGSDIAILTSDNPRTEDPERIMDDVMPGLAGGKEIHREADRRRALALALELARPGDAVLVAGKGHEPYQIIGTVKHPFSDQQTLRELLQ